MVVFDTNGDEIVAKHVVRGETAESAMRSLIEKRAADPCAPDGLRPRIVGFAPPQAVDLPISFGRCSTLRDQVKLYLANTRALQKLAAATATNREDLGRVSSGITKISNAQQSSWQRTMDILAEMKQLIESGKGK